MSIFTCGFKTKVIDNGGLRYYILQICNMQIVLQNCSVSDIFDLNI